MAASIGATIGSWRRYAAAECAVFYRADTWCTVAKAMDPSVRFGQASSEGPIRSGLAFALALGLVFGHALSSCASRGPQDGSAPIVIEYRLASISRTLLPASFEQPATSDCEAGEETERLEYIHPNGRRLSLDVSKDPSFVFDVWQGEVALHEMPLDDGLQVAALAELQIDERRMKKARKFGAKHAGCALAVFVNGALADMLVEIDWQAGLPGGRFATLDQARAVYQRPGMVITIVPEAFEVTRWRQKFRQWQAQQARWRFHCVASFRQATKENYPEMHARLERQEKFLADLSCDDPPKPPPRPVPGQREQP